MLQTSITLRCSYLRQQPTTFSLDTIQFSDLAFTPGLILLSQPVFVAVYIRPVSTPKDNELLPQTISVPAWNLQQQLQTVPTQS